MAKALDYDLQGRVVLVTGAASGIGWATAELFAAMGARVVASDLAADREAATVARLQESGREVLFQSGREVLFRAADVTNGDDVAALLAFVVESPRRGGQRDRLRTLPRSSPASPLRSRAVCSHAEGSPLNMLFLIAAYQEE